LILRPTHPDITLRSMTPADREFLIQVYKSVRQDELDRVPMWDDEQKMAFVLQQFDAQHTHYQKYFGDADFCIIAYKTQPIGRLYLMKTETALHIIDISMLTEWRNKKLGSSIITDIINQAKENNKAVSIHVEKFNPALKLYQRLGFKMSEDVNEVYLKMQWSE